MSKKIRREGISVFQRYLTVWVFLCMVVGILIGKFLPVIPERLGELNIAGISIPIAERSRKLFKPEFPLFFHVLLFYFPPYPGKHFC